LNSTLKKLVTSVPSSGRPTCDITPRTSGTDAISQVDASRWSTRFYYHPTPGEPAKSAAEAAPAEDAAPAEAAAPEEAAPAEDASAEEPTADAAPAEDSAPSEEPAGEEPAPDAAAPDEQDETGP